MNRLLFGLGLIWVLCIPASGHDESLDEATMRKSFPEAIAFMERKKILSREEIRRVEQASQDRVQDTDTTLTYWVALVIDVDLERTRSAGAILMVDANGPSGIIDLVVAYNLDGSVRKVSAMEGQSGPEIESLPFWHQLEGRGPTDAWDPERDFQLPTDPGEARAIIRGVCRGMHLYLTLLDH